MVWFCFCFLVIFCFVCFTIVVVVEIFARVAHCSFMQRLSLVQFSFNSRFGGIDRSLFQATAFEGLDASQGCVSDQALLLRMLRTPVQHEQTSATHIQQQKQQSLASAVSNPCIAHSYTHKFSTARGSRSLQRLETEEEGQRRRGKSDFKCLQVASSSMTSHSLLGAH